MLRKLAFAGLAAASLSAAALSGSTAASANPWGYGGPSVEYYGGPAPRPGAWAWRRHHHWGHGGRPWGGPPAYARPVPPHYGQPLPHGGPHAHAPAPGRGYGPY